MKKKLMTLLLSLVMIASITVPTFAASEPAESSNGTYDWSATGVEVVTGKDKSGNSVWVRGTSNNSPVKELSECPKMDYVKTIDGVTFSNYIRHTTANTKDAAGNTISIYKVYIGIDGAIRSDKDNVEFMTHPKKSYNYINDSLVKTHGGAVNPSMDMNHYKTNTVYFEDSVRNTYRSLSDIGITPYADGGNYGRANDGTWKSGLTWVFNRHKDGEKSNGSYGAIYPMCVKQGDTVTYFQVSVTDATNYSGQRVVDNPISTPPVSDPVELKSFDDVPKGNWAHSYIMLCVQHGAIAGTRNPDANGIGSFSPNTNVTLGQFLTVLTRLLAEDYLDGNAYPTSEGYHWAYGAYEAAVESGIIRGSDFKSDKASLDQALSREDMAYLLVRAASVKGENLEILPRVETMMKDYNSISADRKEAVKQAYSNGLIAGYSDGTFSPEKFMNREQMATVVCRLMEYQPRSTVTVPDDTKPEIVVSQNKAEYVATSGDYKGYLKAGFSRQKELEALSMIKLGEDSKGVYVTFTAPSMPDVIKNEFTFEFTGTVYNSKGDYFADQVKVRGMKAGETKTVYLVSYQDTGVKSSQIAEMRLSVSINNATGYQSMFTRSISTSDKTTAYAKFDIGQADNVKFDSTSIWKGIGK